MRRAVPEIDVARQRRPRILRAPEDTDAFI